MGLQQFSLSPRLPRLKDMGIPDSIKAWLREKYDQRPWQPGTLSKLFLSSGSWQVLPESAGKVRGGEQWARPRGQATLATFVFNSHVHPGPVLCSAGSVSRENTREGFWEYIGKPLQAGGSLHHFPGMSLGFVSPMMHLATTHREKPLSGERSHYLHTKGHLEREQLCNSSCGCQSPDPLEKG